MLPPSTGWRMGLPAEKLDTIGDAIAAFDPPDEDWRVLKAASLRFLETPWHAAVIDHEWSDTAIWGCHPSPCLHVVRRRYDALGLVPGLSLGMGCSIQSIDEHRAIVTRKATGACLVHRRTLTGRAVLWWHAPHTEAQ
jgi:hypothetical protein